MEWYFSMAVILNWRRRLSGSQLEWRSERFTSSTLIELSLSSHQTRNQSLVFSHVQQLQLPQRLHRTIKSSLPLPLIWLGLWIQTIVFYKSKANFLHSAFLSQTYDPTRGLAIAQYFEVSPHLGELIFTLIGYHLGLIEPKSYSAVRRVGFFPKLW